MRVLYISDRRMGGIVSHVKCLTECLPPEVERYVIGVGGDEEFAGTSGHDWREWFQIRRVIKAFRPDIVHFHTPSLFMAAYVRMRRIATVRSWHTPTTGKQGWKHRLFFWLLGKDCYYLPVSTPTWEGLKKWNPKVRGEVFFNPIRIGNRKSNNPTIQQSNNFIVGMVGRNADQKDWPAFHEVERIVKNKFWACGKEVVVGSGSGTVEFLNAGEREPCDGREAIRKMDLFVMTSKHEELPTTVLECFMLGTPICGFIPVGGTSDILGFSKGPVREAFIAERDCDKLSNIVLDLLAHPEKRQALVEDGRQILENHFDAEKNVRERLVGIYGKIGVGERCRCTAVVAHEL